jgi:hypothetical protein
MWDSVLFVGSEIFAIRLVVQQGQELANQSTGEPGRDQAVISRAPRRIANTDRGSACHRSGVFCSK